MCGLSTVELQFKFDPWEERIRMQVKFEREEDGRWIAEMPAIPGALCYAPSQKEAAVKVVALALRILADRLGTVKTCQHHLMNYFAFLRERLPFCQTAPSS